MIRKVVKIKKTISYLPSSSFSQFHHVFLIRHAQSIFNARFQECSVYGDQAEDEFQHDVNLIDSALTYKGLEQLEDLSHRGRDQILHHLSKQEQENGKIGIFVSPLKRALQTTKALMNQDQIIEKCPVFVIPQLSEILSKICDFSSCMIEKKHSYSDYNFEKFYQWRYRHNLQQPDFADWQDPFVNQQFVKKIEKEKKNGFRYLNILKQILPTKLQSVPRCVDRSVEGFKEAQELAKQNHLNIGIFVAHNRVLRYIEQFYTKKKAPNYDNLEIRHFQLNND